MAPRSRHCDLCEQGKPRLAVDEISVTVGGNAYPVRVCDRHQAVMKNMFLGAIPASAFGALDVRLPAKKAVLSKKGRISSVTAKKATAKKTAPVKKATAKKTAPVKKTTAKKTAPVKKTTAKKTAGRPRKAAAR